MIAVRRCHTDSFSRVTTPRGSYTLRFGHFAKIQNESPKKYKSSTPRIGHKNTNPGNFLPFQNTVVFICVSFFDGQAAPLSGPETQGIKLSIINIVNF